MGDGRILKEQAHAAEDLGDPEASRPARPRERERADQRERLKGAEKLAGAPTVRERPDGGMRPGDEEKGEQRWQPWQAAARCAQHTHRHPAVRARRHLGPARSAAHVAVAFRWMTPPGQLTSPLAHRQKIAKRSPPSFVARKSSSSDDQNPDNANGRSSPPPQHRPCTTRTLSRPRSSRTCPADTPRSAHCRPLLQSVPFCRARTLRGHRWSAGCGDRADRGGSVGRTRANAVPPRTCGSQTAASAAVAAAAAAASAGSAMEEGRAKIRMGQVVGAGAAAVRARAGLQVAAFPVAAAGKG
jgi:hypothetical protein